MLKTCNEQGSKQHYFGTHQTIRHKLLSFLDPYAGYNQILNYPSNSMNMTFITVTRMYFYNVMPFGLKNAGATYQRMMSHIFEPLLGNE